MDDGRYTLSGAIQPGDIAGARMRQLASPRIAVNGAATLAERRLDGTLSLRSAALAINADGVVDLARNGFDNMQVTARLLQPGALVRDMRGQRDRAPRCCWTARSPPRASIIACSRRGSSFDADRASINARAAGQGRLSPSPVSVPLRFTAQRGDRGGRRRRRHPAQPVASTACCGSRATTIIGDDLRLRSDKLTSRIELFVDLATGEYTISINGQLGRYLIPGLGIVDVRTQLRVMPGPGGRGIRVVGRGEAIVRRLDNSFLRTLAGGLPRITTGLERGPDGILYLRGVRITAPAINATGNGYRRRDGTFYFEGRARRRNMARSS